MTRALAGYPSDISGDDAKFEVEQAARKRAELRASQNSTWTPKFFETSGQNWMAFKYQLS